MLLLNCFKSRSNFYIHSSRSITIHEKRQLFDCFAHTVSVYNKLESTIYM